MVGNFGISQSNIKLVMFVYLTAIYEWIKSFFVEKDTVIRTTRKVIKFKMRVVNPQSKYIWNPNEVVHLN